MMQKMEFTVSFTTPAFLGNADQQVQWRTPPFKALIRQWWRVANAKRFNYDYKSMREVEGMLFGNAWLDAVSGESRHRRSQLRLRLIPWETGKVSSKEWPGGVIEKVVTTKDGRGQVPADVYLGFGPVLPPSKKEGRPTVTLRGGAIEANNQQARLQIFPSNLEMDMKDTLQLLAWFGTIGSRSRNGWGSLHLIQQDNRLAVTCLPKRDDQLIRDIIRPWKQCLALDWPHALGSEEGEPLIWISTQHYDDWRKVMGCLASIKVKVRRVAKEIREPGGISGIYLLGYPAGKGWELNLDEDTRLASQLRFKVIKTDKGLVGMISHFPCRIPETFTTKLNTEQQRWLYDHQQEVWEKIHNYLNESSRLKPLKEYLR